MLNVLFIILSIIFLLLGLVGLMIPVIPQVPFFALAIFFMANGSKRFKKLIKSTKIYKKYMLEIIVSYKFLAKLFEETYIPKQKKSKSSRKTKTDKKNFSLPQKNDLSEQNQPVEKENFA